MIKPIRKILGQFGGNELLTLLLMLLVGAGVWGFVKLLDKVKDKETQTFDDWAIKVMRKPDDLSKPIGPAWLHGVGRDVTAIGGVAVLVLVVLGVAGFLAMRRQYHGMWFVLASAAGAIILSSALKWTVDRARPQLVKHLSDVYTSSFPSGHSMMSAAIYITLGSLLARFVKERRAKIFILSMAIIITLLVGVSRVYMGVHYPTDVLAGWTAGTVWAIVCWLVARWMQERGTVEEEKPVIAGPAGS
jgi:undecaprenyl-diphosphatase